MLSRRQTRQDNSGGQPNLLLHGREIIIILLMLMLLLLLTALLLMLMMLMIELRGGRGQLRAGVMHGAVMLLMVNARL